MLDSHRALFEARRHSALSDAEFWAASPEAQAQARDQYRGIVHRAVQEFDGLTAGQQPRTVSREWTTVFMPVRLDYPPDRPDGMGWLAELSIQHFARLRHHPEPRVVRRISLFEPDEPITQDLIVNPGIIPTLRGRYPEVTSMEKPIQLDSIQNEPLVANIRQLTEFYSLLIDVKRTACVEEPVERSQA